MKIYFEKFENGNSAAYLTPMKIYEVVESVADGSGAKIKDDEDEEIVVKLIDDHHTGSSWKIISEEPKTQSAADIVASLESERNALANSIDSINEFLDSRSVPKEETLVKRVASALTHNLALAGTTEANIVWRSSSLDRDSYRRNLVRVGMRTESGEVVYFRAELDD